MNFITGLRDYRFAGALLVAALLAGCGPSDDKSKDKKVEPPPPPKVTPAPPPPPKATPAPQPKPVAKPAPKTDTEGWILLGQHQADHRTERERFQVDKGPFRELRVTVQGAPLAISEMIVTFGNDKQFKPSIRQQFDSTNSNQVISLPGDKRRIKHVEFVYRTSATGSGKANVMLHGR